MLCIFDLDGTLVDSLIDLHDATEYALAKLHLPGHDLDEYRFFVGNGVKKLILRALGNNNEALYEQARAYFDKYYESNCLCHTTCYPYIYDCITHLISKGIQVAVYTNKPHNLANKIVTTLFDQHFLFIQGQTSIYPIKPDPTFLNTFLDHYQIPASECIFIGDSDVDIYTAHNANMTSIGVTWGNRDYDELKDAGANYIVFDGIELENKIKEIFKC